MIDMCNQAIVEVLRKSEELTRPQVTVLLGIMDIPTARHDEIIADGISRGLFVAKGDAIRLAGPQARGVATANDFRSAA